MTLKTPLYDTHLSSGAKMTNFGGFSLPIWFSSLKEEHLAVRHGAGVFDISHMGLFYISGEGAYAFLLRLSSNNIGLSKTGKMVYSMMLNEAGFILDDIMVGGYKEGFLLVVNASNKAKIFDWMMGYKPEGVSMQDLNKDHGFIAVQGPDAVQKVCALLSISIDEIGRFGVKELSYKGQFIGVLRTGYTGEDGFELMLPTALVVETWIALVTAGVVPCGLAARDTLRIEAGLPLYGQELSEKITPLMTRYNWVVKFDHEFIGSQALQVSTPTLKTVGIELSETLIARPHYPIQGGGEVTSGTLLPESNRSVAMAIVPLNKTSIGDVVYVDIRGKQIEARVVTLPF